MALNDFKTDKLRQRLELLSYSHLPIILIAVSETKMKQTSLIDHIEYDILPKDAKAPRASLRKTIKWAEQHGLIEKKESDIYSLTDKGKKEVDWIKKLLTFTKNL